MKHLLLTEISGALSYTACFCGLGFGDFMPPGMRDVLRELSTAAFSLPFKRRELISWG